MLMSEVNHIFRSGTYTIQYPMLTEMKLDQIDFPHNSCIMKPRAVTHVVDGEKHYFAMSFSTIGYKSLYEKLLHYISQNIKMSQNSIIDYIVHLYAVIAELHSIPQLIGPLMLQQLFYKEGTSEIYIAGFLNDSVKPLFPIVYHKSAVINFNSDSLVISYVLYCLLTQRFPPIPFLCEFQLDRSIVDVYGNFNFFKYILECNNTEFVDIKDHVVAKLCKQHNLQIQDSDNSDHSVSVSGVETIIEVLKGHNALIEEGLIILLNM